MNLEWAKLGFESSLFEWQLLRFIAAGLIGAALSASGNALQRYLNNDLADPYLLGMSGASVLGAVAMGLIAPLYFVLDSSGILFAYLLGAMVSGGAVLWVIVWARGKFYHTSEGLVLFGVVINAFCASLTMLLMAFDNPVYPKIDYTWFIGRIESYGRFPTFVLAMLLSAGFLLLFRIRKHVELAPYGNVFLRNTGMTPASLNFRLLVSVWLVVSTSSAYAGSIGFVGLMIPHLARRLSSHFSKELLWSMFLGAVFLSVGDYLSRRIAFPRVLPVGILTSVCGSVSLGILLLRAKTYRESSNA